MKFDLVVANYNNGMYLPALVESLRAQTHQSWHLYIVDDCSTDNSAAFLNAFEDDPQIMLMRMPVLKACVAPALTCSRKSVI